MLFDNLVEHLAYRGGTGWQRDHYGYQYVLAGNGLFKAARSPLIRALLPIFYHRIAGLPPLTPECVVLPERVPGLVLHRILDDALRANNQGLEKMYQVDRVETSFSDSWRVTAPAQRMSATRIVYEVGESSGVVCELHSHHRLAAYFSETDDADETAFRFYAVIGRLHDEPEIRLRLGIYGDFIPLPATVLFTDDGPFTDCLTQE